jgi:hypothetical protein
VRLSPFGTSGTNWPIVPTPDDNDDECGAIGGMRIDLGNRSTREKTCLSATLSTTNATLPRLQPGPRGGKPAINSLSYGTAKESKEKPNGA